MNLIILITILSDHQYKGHVKLDLILIPEMIAQIFPQFRGLK